MVRPRSAEDRPGGLGGKSGRVDPKSIFYPESRFGGFTDVDGTIAFYFRVNALLEPSYAVLDVGCGRGKYQDDAVPIRRALRNLKGKADWVIGLDVDEAGNENPFLDEFRRIDGDRWPVEDGSIDLLVCDYVIEHLEEPEQFFAEARRVLRVGGHICIRTPNAWSYVAVAARLVPNRLHARVTRKVQIGRKEEDVFPTFYRCNSIPKLRSALARHGFDAVVRGYGGEPAYLSFSRFAYWLGVMYERHVPGPMRSAVFAFARRRELPHRGG